MLFIALLLPLVISQSGYQMCSQWTCKQGDYAFCPEWTCTLTRDIQCFPEHATVELEGGKTKRMDELIIGDRVWDPTTNAFEPIVTFGHRETEMKERDWVVVHHEHGKTQASPNHLVYVSEKGQTFSWSHIQAFNDLKEGQVMWTSRAGEEMTASAIKKVERTTEKNMLFTPKTSSGTIAVDGMLHSTRAVLNDLMNNLPYTWMNNIVHVVEKGMFHAIDNGWIEKPHDIEANGQPKWVNTLSWLYQPQKNFFKHPGKMETVKIEN